jgi:hypothetical protein
VRLTLRVVALVVTRRVLASAEHIPPLNGLVSIRQVAQQAVESMGMEKAPMAVECSPPRARMPAALTPAQPRSVSGLESVQS